MRPFFSFYGSKWNAAKYYPIPRKQIIIEPFAGSAGYSLKCGFNRKVKLYDVDDNICQIWDYLIRATSSEILSLPLEFDHVDHLMIPKEAKKLIGFWLNKGSSTPSKTPSKWMRNEVNNTQFWSHAIRKRIAFQVPLIRRWTIEQKSYHLISDFDATWFIDPPYFDKGKYYRHSSKDIDYSDLAEFCRTRSGQVIVCEQKGAKWLPISNIL